MTRRQHSASKYPVALTGKRNKKAAANSLQFFAQVEGVEVDGHVRGANGIRWRLA